jgi:hypothetical protein
MPNRLARRMIGAPLAGVLLDQRRTQVLRGFKSRAGRAFAAALVLDEQGAIRFDFGRGAEAAGDGEHAPAAPAPRARPRRARAPRRPRSPPPAATTRAAAAKTAGATATAKTAAATAATKTPAATTPAAAAADLGCPRCRTGPLIAGARGWGCSRWREGCRFVVWFQTAGRRLTAAQLRELVTRGKTRKARFAAGDGSPAMGRLVLDPAADAGAARFEPA